MNESAVGVENFTSGCFTRGLKPLAREVDGESLLVQPADAGKESALLSGHGAGEGSELLVEFPQVDGDQSVVEAVVAFAMLDQVLKGGVLACQRSAKLAQGGVEGVVRAARFWPETRTDRVAVRAAPVECEESQQFAMTWRKWELDGVVLVPVITAHEVDAAEYDQAHCGCWFGLRMFPRSGGCRLRAALVSTEVGALGWRVRCRGGGRSAVTR